MRKTYSIYPFPRRRNSFLGRTPPSSRQVALLLPPPFKCNLGPLYHGWIEGGREAGEEKEESGATAAAATAAGGGD